MGTRRRIFGGTAALVVLAATTLVTTGAPVAATTLVRTATFSGTHAIPEAPSNPAAETTVLPSIQLDIGSAGLPTNAQVVDVDVTVELTHPNMGEVDLYLARPLGRGEMVRLLSDVGSTIDVDGVRFTFDDHAPRRLLALPEDGERYRPNNLGDDNEDALSLADQDDTGALGFVPGGQQGADEAWGALDEFHAAGIWELFALDDTGNDITGTITFAQLTITLGATDDGGITIPTQGPGDPSPATIEFVDDSATGGVDNIHDQGSIRDIAVYLDSFDHVFPGHVQIAVQGPTGAVAILLADNTLSLMTGGGVNLRFVPDGPSPPTMLVSGTYGPHATSTDPLETLFPGTGLSGPQTGGLEQFVGTDPEGTWRLFARDAAAGTGGRIERWSLAFDINARPTAADDSVTVDEDDTVSGDVLLNDSDPEGDGLTASLVEGPEHGGVTIRSDGSFDYTPEPDYHGPDSFRYRAFDGDLDDVATVSITVAPVNDAPVVAADAYDATEDQTLTVDPEDGVLTNDGDADGDLLIAVLADGPDHGTVVLDPDGGFTYTPDADFNGEDAFTYRADDGAAPARAKALSPAVTVTLAVAAVNDAPTATDDTASVAAGGTVVVDVLANDADVDGDPLTVTLLDGPARGTATCGPAGCTYAAPAGDPGGVVTFRYRSTDPGGLEATATVSVTVAAAQVATTSTSTTAGGALARTGTDGAGLRVRAAAALVAAGVALVVGARSWRRPAHARR